jgi:glyoxylase-like metal-dependent hydrolase (beta-lactamase superfamily II)
MTPWTDLGGGVLVRQSRVFWMNSVLLLDREHAVLVDPGVLPSELDEIAAAVSAAGPRTVSIVFTHSHWDHVLGRPWWPQADTVGHAGLGAELQRDAAAILASHGAGASSRSNPIESWKAGLCSSGTSERRCWDRGG